LAKLDAALGGRGAAAAAVPLSRCGSARLNHAVKWHNHAVTAFVCKPHPLRANDGFSQKLTIIKIGRLPWLDGRYSEKL
jgi:hypothetical protein